MVKSFDQVDLEQLVRTSKNWLRCVLLDLRSHNCDTGLVGFNEYYWACGPISFSLAQSGQMISSPSVMKPRPAILFLQRAHRKHCECQCRPSKLMNLVPPCPVIGLLQLVHLLAKSSPKQLAQYGLSSLLANFWPAKGAEQFAQRKQDLCQGSPLKVTPPVVKTPRHFVHFVATLSSKQGTQ